MAGTLSATVITAAVAAPTAAGFGTAGALGVQSILPLYSKPAAFGSAGVLSSPMGPLLQANPTLSASGALASTLTTRGILNPTLGTTGQLQAAISGTLNRIILTDNFNRADDTAGLGTASGGGTWTNRNGVVGINGNAAYPASPAGASVNYSTATHDTLLTKDDMSVSVTLGTLSGEFPTETSWIVLGASTSGECVIGWIDADPGNEAYSIRSVTPGWPLSGTTTFRASAGGIAAAEGDVIMLHRIGNVYSLVLNNSALLCRWIDSTNIVPRDSSHRLCGVGGRLHSSDRYRRFDSWQAEEDPAALPFLAFAEVNIAQTNQPVPAGCTGCYVTAYGAAGGGGSGRKVSSTNGGGGAGGGGGGGIPRTSFIPVASLGSTYTTTVQLTNSPGGAGVTVNGNGNPGTAGGATTFVSGSINIRANGGGGGGGGGNNVVVAGGAGGTVSGASGYAGAAGASTVTTGTPSAGGNGTSVSGGGGGAGGTRNSIGTNGSGSSGGNGEGSYTGGIGRDAGSGTAGGNGNRGCGGGGSGGGTGNTPAGGLGGYGYLKIEWV